MFIASFLKTKSKLEATKIFFKRQMAKQTTV